MNQDNGVTFTIRKLGHVAWVESILAAKVDGAIKDAKRLGIRDLVVVNDSTGEHMPVSLWRTRGMDAIDIVSEHDYESEPHRVSGLSG